MTYPKHLRARGHFANLVFPKTGLQIIEKATTRREQVDIKIGERKDRIKVICTESGLEVHDLLANFDDFMAGLSNAFVREGELPPMQQGNKAALIEESKQVQNDKKLSEELRQIADNLPKDQTFELTFEELAYFGF